MTESEVLDPGALERLHEWGGEKLVAQMIRLFLKNSGTRMDQIRTGVAEENPQESEWGAHSLKSSAANIGADLLRSLATHVESASLDKDMDRLSELLPQIEDAYSVVMDELRIMEEGLPHES